MRRNNSSPLPGQRGFLHLIFNYIKELQYLMKWSNLFHNKHALKITELIPIRVEFVFANFNMGLLLKLIVTCLKAK